MLALRVGLRPAATQCLRPAATAALRGFGAEATPVGPGLLKDLPDFALGANHLREGHASEAKAPLERALEVADAYFPQTASRERALCRSSLGRCLWLQGRCKEAAAQWEAAAAAAKSSADSGGNAVPPAAGLTFAVNAATARFQAGEFELAAKAIAEGELFETAGVGVREQAMLSSMRAAVEAVRGSGGGQDVADGEQGSDSEAAMFLAGQKANFLIGRSFPDSPDPSKTSVAQDLEVQLEEGTPLANLLLPKTNEDPANGAPAGSVAGMTVRGTLGELAVRSGEGTQRWVRPMLLAALREAEALPENADPVLTATLWRTLSSLALLLGRNEPVSAEGLLRSAIDHTEKVAKGPMAPAFASGRGLLWRAQALTDFAKLLEDSRRAEERKTDTARLREQAAALLKAEKPIVELSPQELRWSMAWLPPVQAVEEKDLGF